jgi:hypothetical protein
MRHKLSKLVILVLAIVAIAGGAAFAVLQSQPGLVKGNVIQTAVASLQVSPNGTTYGSEMDGYVFGNLIPGGQPTPLNGYPIYVKNVGTTPLALKLSVKPLLANPDNVDLGKVHVILTPIGGGAPQNLLLQDLINTAGGITVNQAIHLMPEQVFQLTLQVSMEADAINGSSATLSNVDFNFGALAVN